MAPRSPIARVLAAVNWAAVAALAVLVAAWTALACASARAWD